ncbi:hypothetical protein PLESTM_002032500 [Pleodorina starrii]|nr:hypothetical protein PLESTM_002032500 [Pleodorina starrii]
MYTQKGGGRGQKTRQWAENVGQAMPYRVRAPATDSSRLVGGAAAAAAAAPTSGCQPRPAAVQPPQSLWYRTIQVRHIAPTTVAAAPPLRFFPHTHTHTHTVLRSMAEEPAPAAGLRAESTAGTRLPPHDSRVTRAAGGPDQTRPALEPPSPPQKVRHSLPLAVPPREPYGGLSTYSSEPVNER